MTRIGWLYSLARDSASRPGRFGALCLVLTVAFSSQIRADDWDKKTEVTFTARVEVPGKVLEPGHYVLKLLASPSNRNIVGILSEKEDHVYMLMFTVPAYRSEPPDRTILTFYEMPAGQPKALREWFYPGDKTGREFVYSSQRAKAIALATKGAGPSPPPPQSPPAEERPAIAAVTPSPRKAAPAPVKSAAILLPEPTVANSLGKEDSALLTTASPLPAWALFGLLALASALGLRFWRINHRAKATIRS